MKTLFRYPDSLTENVTTYCPGCGHGVVHRLIAEAIDELGMRERTVAVAPVGCAVLAYDFFNFDVTEAAHGRPPAVATGIKRTLPDRLVFTYQGDGDLAAIGTAEIIHAGARGENITVIFVNNAVYGMTKGQMAPTTLPGQQTTTTTAGRDVGRHGHPLRMCELLSVVDGVCYAERVAVDTVPNILRAKRAIRKAFHCQLAGLGLSFVEVLAACPVNWKMSPAKALRWIAEEMVKVFPLGVVKDLSAGADGA